MTVNQTAKNPVSPLPPGFSVARRQDFTVELASLPPWVRPEVAYWYPTWRRIRDATAGEREVKNAAGTYLPALEGMTATEYADFKDRATFYNFTERTISAMAGSIFRRQALIEGMPEDEPRVLGFNEARTPSLANITSDGNPFDTIASWAGEEVIGLGRVGVLVDLSEDATVTPAPYFEAYSAENILDWDEDRDVNGRKVWSRVVLRESHEVRDPVTQERKTYASYRELILEDGVYKQYVYLNPTGHADLTPAYKGDAIIPTRRGKPLNFIPFRIIGPHASSADVEKPPMEDIANLNFSHYRSYGYLEHGRFFAGFPVYIAEEPQQGGQVNYQIGSGKVWVICTGGNAKILEMNGQGLKFLESALDQKEAQAATLGGRMMDVRPVATSESNAALKLKERNEQSQLLKVARQLDRNFTWLLQVWAWWRGMDEAEAAKISVTFNKDFLFDGIGAREFRAVQSMYKDGILPIDVVYHYLKKSDVIPDWMTIEEFKSLLDKMDQFPNQPDAQARQEGFANRQQQLTDDQKGATDDYAEGMDAKTKRMLAEQQIKDARKKAAQPPPTPMPTNQGPIPPPFGGRQPPARGGA